MNPGCFSEPRPPPGAGAARLRDAGAKAVRHTRSKLSVPVLSEVARLAGEASGARPLGRAVSGGTSG